jgi:hypothetical protein
MPCDAGVPVVKAGAEVRDVFSGIDWLKETTKSRGHFGTGRDTYCNIKAAIHGVKDLLKSTADGDSIHG